MEESKSMKTKTIKKTYRVQTRSNRKQPWRYTYFSLPSRRAARRYIKLLIATLQWRIIEHREVIKVLATRPWKACVKQRQAMCKQWPRCACIVRGTVKDCLLGNRI